MEKIEIYCEGNIIKKGDWWVCEYCGLKLSFEEVCKSKGHHCVERKEVALESNV